MLGKEFLGVSWQNLLKVAVQQILASYFTFLSVHSKPRWQICGDLKGCLPKIDWAARKLGRDKKNISAVIDTRHFPSQLTSSNIFTILRPRPEGKKRKLCFFKQRMQRKQPHANRKRVRVFPMVVMRNHWKLVLNISRDSRPSKALTLDAWHLQRWPQSTRICVMLLSDVRAILGEQQEYASRFVASTS